MILAVILSICLFGFAPAPAPGVVCAAIQSSEQQASPAKPSEGNTGQGKAGNSQNSAAVEFQTPSSAAPSSAAPSAQTPSAKKPSPAGKRTRHKKKAVSAVNCTDPTPAPGSPTSSDPSAPADTATSGSAPPAKCPPAKTVVHNGGTTEPTIQLVGGVTGQQAAGQRFTTDQLVGSTEENLKKIAGRQLNSSQQEMLNQIHQFLQQSKAAIAAGDIERGHNLAMKAHLLSDELAKP